VCCLPPRFKPDILLQKLRMYRPTHYKDPLHLLLLHYLMKLQNSIHCCRTFCRYVLCSLFSLYHFFSHFNLNKTFAILANIVLSQYVVFSKTDKSLVFKQEAPLTLRSQHGRCRNIKGEPQIYGSFLTQSHAHFYSGCGGPWQTQAMYQI